MRAESKFRKSAVTAMQYLTGTILGIGITAVGASGLYPYLLNLARGRAVEFSDAWHLGPQLGRALVLTAMVVVATALGSLFCAIPGIAVVVVTSTAFPLLFDHEVDALTALRESFERTKAHPIQMLFFGLMCVGTTLIGIALCVVGAVLVSAPIVLLAQIYVHLRLEGESPVRVPVM
jgi:uncharacterized membrane protein